MKGARVWIGASLLFLIVLVALLAPLLAPYSPSLQNLPEQLRAPSFAHWLGQNQHGQDLLSLMIYGARISLSVGLATVVVSLFLGTTLGLWAGYAGGVADQTISRVMEIILAFPGILLAIGLAAVLGPSVMNVVLALCAGGWVSFARLSRALTLSLREREFVQGARSLGASTPTILFRHILPNMAGPLVVQASFAMSAAVLAESTLSFLGLGAGPGTPSWGGAISDGTRYLLQAPHLATFPGIAIMITVLALNFLGDGLRDQWHES